jgi:hypothetical protein
LSDFDINSMISLLLVAAMAVASVLCKNSYPVFPDAFNATLFKIGPGNDASPARWAKFYYQYIPKGHPNAGGFSRFDFYNHYANLDRQWEAYCQILFYPTHFYVIDLHRRQCQLRPGVGNLSKYWLKNARFNATLDFRGVYSDLWLLDTDDGVIEYFVGHSNGVPLRSTNQANDPGATDYFDVMIGPQRDDLFDAPPECMTPVDRVACPVDEFIVRFRHQQQ